MKLLMVFFIILHLSYKFATPTLDLNAKLKATSLKNSSKPTTEPLIKLDNRTENKAQDNGSLPANVNSIHFTTSATRESRMTMEEQEQPSEIYEDHRTDIVSFELKQQHVTKLEVEQALATDIMPRNNLVEDISTPSQKISTHQMVENKTMVIKLGSLVNVSCGPNDITKLVEKNFGKNVSITNMSWQWKVLWLNYSEEKEADGIQITENGGTIILSISSFRTDHSGTYTCAAQDPSNKVWILKTLELIASEQSKEGIMERSSDEKHIHQSTPAASPNQSDSTDGDYQPTIRPENNYQESQQDVTISPAGTTFHPAKSSDSIYLDKWTSTENIISPESSEDISPSSIGLLPANSIEEKDDDKVQTPKIFFLVDDLTTSTNISENQIAEEPAKMEEQKAVQAEDDNNASGVAIGVTLAIILTAVATTLVLYRHRRNGKKSTYITFGNPSYSRENLPANDYGLDSPLTLSSNGYTVLA